MSTKLDYLHHRVACAPRRWNAVAERIISTAPQLKSGGGILFGVWRSQIGRPRDELNLITAWSDGSEGRAVIDSAFKNIADIRSHEMTGMVPTLRPVNDIPPVRQGNFAFRWQETPAYNWDEFLALCVEAWPGFESSYDSQVVGLWRVADEDESSGMVRSLLMTRRPDLAMWERSKIPQGEAEQAVRSKLNRRYDLCESTCVYTTTLLTAQDRVDRERWT